MKTKITSLVFAAFCTIGLINAQELGNMLLGGNLRFAYDSQDEIQLSISPVLGKIINHNVTIGITFGFFYNNQYGYSSDDKAILLAPFVRIHKNIAENFKFYVEPNFGKTFVLGDESENKTQIYNAGVNFGLLYFISQNMSLELNIAGINYLHISDKDYASKYNYVSIDYDLVTPNIGLKYYF